MKFFLKAGEKVMNADDFKTLSEKGFDEYHVDGAEFKKMLWKCIRQIPDIIKEFNVCELITIELSRKEIVFCRTETV